MAYIAPDTAHDLWAEVDEGPEGLYIVTALDPGGTTGWCTMGVHPDALTGDPDVPILGNVEWWTAGQFEGAEDDQADEIVELIHSWPTSRIIIEDFILRSQAGLLGREVLSPVRITAKVVWAIRPRYAVLQMPSLAMGTITDERQKDWGFWLPGQPHARDAIKHALTFVKRNKDRALKAAGIAR